MISAAKRGLARLSRRVRRLWMRAHQGAPVATGPSEQERVAARQRFWAEVAAGRRLADEARRAH